MKPIAQLISWLALASILLAAILFFSDQLALPTARLWMLLAALVWFVATPVWMEHKVTD